MPTASLRPLLLPRLAVTQRSRFHSSRNPVVAELGITAKEEQSGFLPAVAAGPDRKMLTRRERMLVSLIFASWNQMAPWLRQIEGLRGCLTSSEPVFSLSRLL